MAPIAAVASWSSARAFARAAQRCLVSTLSIAAALFLIAGLLSGAAQAQPVKGTATFSASGGYARLVLKLDEDVESEVSLAGSIVVIRFKRPVDVPIDSLSDAVPEYVGSARRDPDGSAIRLALSRKVTVNSMAAGERLFIDLLPDSWTGLPPSLPQEVVRELSERARVAERALRAQRAESESRKRTPIRVRASVQPTFVRFVFELPDASGVSSVLGDKKMSLSFNAPLTFDLADAKLAAPPNIASIAQKLEGSGATVEIGLIGDVDVHSFREEKNYIVDIGFQQPEKPSPLKPAAEAEHGAKPPHETRVAPVKPMTEAAPAKPVTEAAPATVLAEIAPPTSESIAREAKVVETKPEAKAEPAASAHALPEAPMVAVVAQEAPAAPKEIPAPVVMPKLVEAALPAKPEGDGVPVDAKRSSDGLRLSFSFASPVPAALFRRSDALWLVFDSAKPFDVAPIRREGGALIGDVSRIALDKGQAIRIRLNRPQMASLISEETPGNQNWVVVLGDTVQAPSQPLLAVRNIIDPAHASVSVPLLSMGLTQKLEDPDAGDVLSVVTALPPVRGFIKRQNFVEFSLLESIHGVVIQANSEDVGVVAASDRVTLGRPGGLTLSPSVFTPGRASSASRPLFDGEEWRKNREGPFIERLDGYVTALGQAEEGQRAAARLDLARFYFARQMFWEAKGLLNLALSDADADKVDPMLLVLHAIACTATGHPERSLKDLAIPAVGAAYDSQLWKGFALARQGKWADAREKFKSSETAIASLPAELQRLVLVEAMKASLEVKDYPGASARSSDLDLIGVAEEIAPAVSVMRGRLAEATGREEDALSFYKTAMASSDRPAVTEGKLREIALRQKRNELSQDDALRDLETQAMLWRGDGLEVKTLQMLEKIYANVGRYREAFNAARTATRLQPNSEASRQLQDDASALFAQLYLSAKGDDMPPVEALAMFYDNSELTPIGRRGDEMIRRLADRLVNVDLLDQAAELLQYQVDQRLEGAARSQVAARLAMIYLMNRKPDRAIGALRSTRIADLSGELRQQRLLLEARAQSDIGRRDLGLDIISNLGGREAIRLRSDIHWASRRWREASEQIELYYGDRWRDFKPLNSVEKGDIIRAVVGYALAEDGLGLARFREKYAPLMSGEADRTAFDVASKPASNNSADFTTIAKMAAGVDTLDGFLREMKTRFPDMTARATLPPEAKADPMPTGSLPQIVGAKRAEAGR